MADRVSRRARVLFYAMALVWLPAGVVLSAVIRFGSASLAPGDWPTMTLMAATSLLVAAPCGLPLALAGRRLMRAGYPRAAWLWGVLLGAATVAASLPAGLFGPPGIAVAALLLSLPLWIAAFWLRRRADAGAAARRPPLDGRDRGP